MSATKNLKKKSKAKRPDRKRGQLYEKDQKLSKKLYTQGPAAYGIIQNLRKASKLSNYKVETFLAGTDAHTKYRTPRKKLPRLKVQAYRVNEIWSIYVAYMDKIAKYSNGVKYSLIAVVLTWFLRVNPWRPKLRQIQLVISREWQQKHFLRRYGQTKQQSLKEFKQFCDSKKMQLLNTHK